LEEKGFLPTVKQVCHKDSLEFSTMWKILMIGNWKFWVYTERLFVCLSLSAVCELLVKGMGFEWMM
jgi:hypothetical protein